MTARRLAEASGVGVLFVLPFVWAQLSPENIDMYHRLLPMTSVAGGLLLAWVGMTLLSLAAFAVIDRARPWPKAMAWVLVCAVLGWMVVRDAILLLAIFAMRVPWPHVRYTLWAPVVVLGLGAVLLLFFRRNVGRLDRGLRSYGRIIKGMRLGLAIAGCGALVILPRLAYLASRSQPVEGAGFRRSPLPGSAGRPQNRNLENGSGERPARIIWILMDELSYDQSFDHRQPGIMLPHLDHLAQNSTVFSDLQPAGYYTEEVVISLLLGRTVARVRSDEHGMPSLRFAKQTQWTPFDAEESIFGDAQRLGWSTGIAGWYNPYCRILGSVLDSCYWTFNSPLPGGLSGRKQAAANALSLLPLADLAQRVLEPGETGSPTSNFHLADYRNLMARAGALLGDDRIRFVMVHLPVPHPPGIYDRRSGSFRQGGTYLDNLVLADAAVGELLAELDRTPSAGSTTVIVSSDHSWRVPLWRSQAHWTAEEEAASRGRFDPRPLLIIHFPGQTANDDIAEPVNELLLHGMLEAMLRGQMDSAPDLRNWLAMREDGERNGD